jgi:hypothetical protein
LEAVSVIAYGFCWICITAVIKLQIMNQQFTEAELVDPMAALRKRRAETAKKNIAIFNETGISMKDLQSEIKAQINALLRQYNRLTKGQDGLKRYLHYEGYLYELISDIEFGLKTSLEIQEEFKEVKKRLEPFMNSK